MILKRLTALFERHWQASCRTQPQESRSVRRHTIVIITDYACRTCADSAWCLRACSIVRTRVHVRARVRLCLSSCSLGASISSSRFSCAFLFYAGLVCVSELFSWACALTCWVKGKGEGVFLLYCNDTDLASFLGTVSLGFCWARTGRSDQGNRTRRSIIPWDLHEFRGSRKAAAGGSAQGNGPLLVHLCVFFQMCRLTQHPSV